jgi:hypothetical protein
MSNLDQPEQSLPVPEFAQDFGLTYRKIYLIGF